MTAPFKTHSPLQFLYPPRCFAASRRNFSVTPWHAAGGRGALVQPKMRQTPQKSFKVAMQEMMKKGDMSNDMGLLPDTLVMPTGSNKPSFVSLPRERLRLEWHRLKKRVMDLFSVIVYWRTVPKPRPKFVFWNKAKAAQALHTQMYSAFAEGDTDILKEICADGLLNNFTGRIAQRPRNEQLQWTLHKHVKGPRVVSHRAAPLPEIEGAGIRQAIVRITSRQSLAKRTHHRPEAEPIVQEKEEYVVIQKRMFDKKEGPWVVWGTVEEAEWEKIVF